MNTQKPQKKSKNSAPPGFEKVKTMEKSSVMSPIKYNRYLDINRKERKSKNYY